MPDEIATFNSIAVVGIGLNLPQSSNKEEFWKNLMIKKTAFKEFPSSRREQIADLYDENKNLEFEKCAYLDDIAPKIKPINNLKN
jgi:acyl transferase domain-containing protein